MIISFENGDIYIFGDANCLLFFGAKRFVCTNFHPFCKAGPMGFVGYIHGLSISHELKTYPMGWLLGGKKEFKMYQWLYIQLDKEDNILKNGKSS